MIILGHILISIVIVGFTVNLVFHMGDNDNNVQLVWGLIAVCLYWGILLVFKLI